MVMNDRYDAVLIVAYGGPEKMADVIPFLENALRGRNVPRSRLEEVGAHYKLFDGVSPINRQMRALRDALLTNLSARGIELPVYIGNRNWHPLLPDTLRTMRDDGIKRALAFFTSPYSSYSSCRQYRENITLAREAVGADAPQVDKLRAYYNHPSYIAATIDRVRDGFAQIPVDRRDAARLVFSAHSIPLSMAQGCRYVEQLRETCRLTAEALNIGTWDLVWQSRSGPPQQPWLEPDICDHLRDLRDNHKVTDVVLMPAGFICDHMEVVYDLDTEAAATANEIGLNLVRAASVSTHGQFVDMIRQLIEERTLGTERLAVGNDPAGYDDCPIDCCPPPQRPSVSPKA